MVQGESEPVTFADRNPAIDMLRALTMCLMIFVNNLWTIGGVPHWMLHAQAMEDFMGLSDIVFPSFLFAMGMSIPYAIENRFRKGQDAASTLWHIIRRAFALIVMGLFTVNAGDGLRLGPQSRNLFLILMTVGFFLVWNDYRSVRKAVRIVLQLLGTALLVWMVLRYRTGQGNVFQPKWWGILGLIGWAYLACAVIYLIARDRLKYLGTAWLVFLAVCTLSTMMRSGHCIVELPQPNVYDKLRDILRLDNGAHHALAMGGAILSVVGVKYASNWTERRRTLTALAATAVFTGLGFLAHRWFIVSKILATLPWVLWTTALCILLYALLQILVRHGFTRWFKLIGPAGTATLTTYLVPYVLIGFCSITGLNLWNRFSGITGILYCIGYVALVLAITWLLGKLHVKVKI